LTLPPTVAVAEVATLKASTIPHALLPRNLLLIDILRSSH
jgi:hypothetical protein